MELAEFPVTSTASQLLFELQLALLQRPRPEEDSRGEKGETWSYSVPQDESGSTNAALFTLEEVNKVLSLMLCLSR